MKSMQLLSSHACLLALMASACAGSAQPAPVPPALPEAARTVAGRALELPTASTASTVPIVEALEGRIPCRFEPNRPLPPDIRGRVIAVAGTYAVVRIDNDSDLPADRGSCSMAIYSVAGYIGELKIEGGADQYVFGEFLHGRSATRGICIGDRASCRTP